MEIIEVDRLVYVDCKSCGYKGYVEDKGHVVCCPKCPGGAKVEESVKNERSKFITMPKMWQ